MTRRWLRRSLALITLLALALAGCTTLDEQQRKWVFQPSKHSWWRGAAAAEGMQDVWIDFHSSQTDSEARLHGLWLAQPNADAPLLLYLHGARWDVRSSAFRMRRMHELGFAVLGIDYRGFGQSTDTLPSETLAYEDARAAWDWLGEQHRGVQRYIFGHSLGAAIAVQLASEVDDEGGLLVEGSFTSLADVVGSFRWGWLPIGPLITQRFDAGSRIAQIGSPLLVVHGGSDTLILPSLGRALFERALPPKRFVLIDGGSHHNTNAVGQPQYREAIGALFGIGAEAVKSRGPIAAR
jgi:alpha-beta hydrolase superfamily lysophospholipase